MNITSLGQLSLREVIRNKIKVTEVENVRKGGGGGGEGKEEEEKREKQQSSCK